MKKNKKHDMGKKNLGSVVDMEKPDPGAVVWNGIQIPTYQRFWERTMKLEERIDRLIKMVIALSIAVVLLAINVIL